MGVLKVTFACVLLGLVLEMGVDSLSCRCKGVCLDAVGCKGGLVKGACGCCNVCAKVEGEKCGGPWYIAGRCDKELDCVKSRPNDFNAEGVCQPKAGPFHTPILRAPCMVHPVISRLPTWLCKSAVQTYCTRDCSSCCSHDTTCHPDPFKYVMADECPTMNE